MRATAALLVGTSILAVAALPRLRRRNRKPSPRRPTQPPPPAEQDEGAIIVTATKRASTVQDVPFSVNAQTQADMQRANAQTIEDISRNVAGLTVQNLGPGQSQVSIRGVSAGQIVRDQPGVKEQVGIYLDESPISLSLFTPDFDLFDLNRVETLRGPQGTLFGCGLGRRHDPLHHQSAEARDRSRAKWKRASTSRRAEISAMMPRAR